MLTRALKRRFVFDYQHERNSLEEKQESSLAVCLGKALTRYFHFYAADRWVGFSGLLAQRYQRQINELIELVCMIQKRSWSNEGIVIISCSLCRTKLIKRYFVSVSHHGQVLFRFGLAFFKHVEEEILELTDYMGIFSFLRILSHRMHDVR